MSKRTDTTSIPKQAAAQELLESATALLTNRKDVATVKEDAVNPPFSPLSFFKPTLLSVASVIAFLLNPKASHGQSTLFLNAFCEDLTRHLEAAGLALSVKVPPLTDKTSRQRSLRTLHPERSTTGLSSYAVLLRTRRMRRAQLIQARPWTSSCSVVKPF